MLFKAGEKEEEEGSRTKEGVSEEEEEDTLEKLDLKEVEIYKKNMYFNQTSKGIPLPLI